MGYVKIEFQVLVSLNSQKFVAIILKVVFVLFFQMIDDYVGVESLPTEKEQKWRAVTR